MIKALIFDIDETLIPYTTCKIEQSTIEAIQLVKSKGIKVIVATGRNYSCIHPDVKEYVKPDIYVTVNGNCISDKEGNPIKVTSMDKIALEKMLNICDEKGYLYGIKCARELITMNHHDEYCELYCDQAITKDMLTDKSMEPDYWKEKDEPLGVFFFSKNNEAMSLQKDFEMFKFYPFLDVGCECCNKEMNKGKALRELMESLGIDLSQCMAFGDSNNDVDMIEMCGIGIAMGNGNENAKKAANYITTAADDNGIYNALKHFEII